MYTKMQEKGNWYKIIKPDIMAKKSSMLNVERTMRRTSHVRKVTQKLEGGFDILTFKIMHIYFKK